MGGSNSAIDVAEASMSFSVEMINIYLSLNFFNYIGSMLQ